MKELSKNIGISPGFEDGQDTFQPTLQGKTILFVVNPAAGNGLSKLERLQIDQAAAFIQAHNNTVEIKETSSPGHATEIAKNAQESGFYAIIAVGGDGTLNEVIQSTVNTDLVVGIIPTGFFNLWAEEINVPNDIKKAAEALIASEAKSVDLGKINDSLFLQFANLGFDSEQYMKLHRPGSVRSQSGKALFLQVAALCTRDIWEYPGHEVQIQSDDKIYDANLLVGVLGNATKYGPMTINEEAILDDGIMEGTFFTGLHGPKLLFQFPMVYINQGHRAGVLRDRFKKIIIECKTNDKIGITIDGNPLEFSNYIAAEVLPSAQQVLIPHNAPVTLFKGAQ